MVHASVEATKLAMADREAWYGDVDTCRWTTCSRPPTPDRRALIGRPGQHASCGPAPRWAPAPAPRLRHHHAAGRRRPAPAIAGIGEPTVDARGTTRGDTCHVDVVDRWGNLVSATPSGGWLQSSPVIPELGFALGTRAQMFWLEPGLPNSLAPGKRPRTTLTPSLALRDGVPALAFGTPGGDQQEQWQLCFWLAHVLGGLDLQAAIDAPAWHTTSFPSSFYPRDMSPGELVVESRLGDGVIAELRRRGHAVTVSDPWSLGRLSAVSRDPETGILRAAANPRGMQGTPPAGDGRFVRGVSLRVRSVTLGPPVVADGRVPSDTSIVRHRCAVGQRTLHAPNGIVRNRLRVRPQPQATRTRPRETPCPHALPSPAAPATREPAWTPSCLPRAPARPPRCVASAATRRGFPGAAAPLRDWRSACWTPPRRSSR